VNNGWDQVGHHLVKNNHISHCAKNGIHSSLGAPFLTITGNEIHDITINHQFGGCDTAGIKILGGVDVIIRDNHVYNCAHWGGIWLDWMAQGARVSGNLLHDNSQDLMFEVNHGPHLVDNNLLLSGTYITDASGGGAFVHNTWYGKVNIWPDLTVRKTPYFKPHSVEIVDRIDVNQDDERFYNNVFIGSNGTSVYDETDIQITAKGNVFVAGATPSRREVDAVREADFDPEIKITQEADGWWLEMLQPPAGEVSRELITSEILGKATVPDAPFENRDGTPYTLNTDYFGEERSAEAPAAGPFSSSHSGQLRVKVWPKVL
jgi:alpha-N-arabinofuranosidase